jgi:hypothetical protein
MEVFQSPNLRIKAKKVYSFWLWLFSGVIPDSKARLTNLRVFIFSLQTSHLRLFITVIIATVVDVVTVNSATADKSL